MEQQQRSFEVSRRQVVGMADGHGNSVPRFHVTWGTGPAIVEPFEKRVRAAAAAGKVVFRFRHRVDEIVRAAGRIVNPDRMWHYTEGLRNWDPIWPGHGIRILPGPSSMWFDATGRRFAAPDRPGYDTLHTLGSITASGYDHCWFVTTQKIADKEFALSGSEQNPDPTNKNLWLLLTRGHARPDRRRPPDPRPGRRHAGRGAPERTDPQDPRWVADRSPGPGPRHRRNTGPGSVRRG